MTKKKSTYKELEIQIAELKRHNEYLSLNSKTGISKIENHYPLLFENSKDGFAFCRMIFENDIATDFVYLEVNAAFEKLTGSKNVRGRTVTDVFPDINETYPELLKIYGSVALTGAHQKFEIVSKSAKTFLSVSVICPEKGYVIAIFENITARKQSEQELKESEVEYHQLTDNIDAIVWRFDLINDQWVYVSAQTEKILGYLPNEWLNFKWWIDIMHPEDQTWAPNFCINQTKLLNKHDFEYRLIKKNGDHVWVHDKVGVQIIDNEPAYLYGVMFDITEKKNIELALKVSEEKYRKIIETTSEGFWLVDKKGKLIDVNPAYSELIGYSKDELLTMSIEDIEAFENNEQIELRIEKVIKNGHDRFETVHKCKNGSLINVEISTSYFPLQESQFIVFIHDITKRNKIYEKLIESEKRYRKIFENAQEGIFQTHINGSYLSANPALAKMYGFDSPEELLISRTNISEEAYSDPKERDNFLRIMEQQGFVKGYEYEVKRKDGSKIWFYEDAQAVKDENGNILYFEGFVVDITKRKQVEEALSASVSLLNASLESTADGILIVDSKGKIIKWNQKFSQMWQLTDEILSTNDDNFVISHILSQLTIPEQFVDNVKYLYAHPDESSFDQIEFLDERIYERYSQPQRLGNDIVGRVWSFRDITRRKQAEEALKESEERFRGAFETSAIGMALVSRTGYFMQVNHSLCKMLGYENSELLSKSLQEITHPDDLKADVELLRKTIQGVIPSYQIEKRYFDKNKNLVWANLSVSMVRDTSNRPLYFVSQIENITGRKQNELIIEKQNQELHQLNTDKDRFITILAHDLKSPFNTLLGFSGLLIKNIRKYDIDKIERLTNIIHQTAKQTYNLLDDILMWTLSQSGKLPFEPVKFNIGDICLEIIENLRLTAKAKSITINNYAIDEIYIFADINMLKTILRNLISNAIKFTNTNGHISIYAEKNQTNITVSVSDTGIGIEPEILSKLFDISQKITTEGTAKESGTGFGLLLCKEFIEKHKGKIWVESEVGKGSKFKFTLPLSAQDRNPSSC